MLHVSKISRRFAGEIVLEDVSFSLGKGEKVGLVGANGSGKSTLLRILAGLETADTGQVRFDPNVSACYLAQQVEEPDTTLVGDLLASGRPDWHQAGRSLGDAIERMVSEPADAIALEDYAGALERFEALGGYGVQHSIDRIRAGLEIDSIPLEVPVTQLSGGEKTRVALGALLFSACDVLLLDEPTNHLDLPALLWLERWIRDAPQAAIIISHDREFLDRTVNRTLFIDDRTHTVSIYQGGYSAMQSARQREREAHLALYLDQQEKIEKVEREIRELKNRASRTEKSTVNFAIRKIAMGTARRAVVQERRLHRDLDGEQRVEKPAYDRTLYLAGMTQSGLPDRRLILSAHGIAASVSGKRILDQVSVEFHGGDRVWLSGPNGSGKTTLLNVLAGGDCDAGKVQKGANISLGYLHQEHLRIDVPDGLTVLDSLRKTVSGEESAIRALLDQFLFTGQEVMKQVAHLSYGERLRFELARLVGEGSDALLLDEPTNHLDIAGIERLQAALASYQGPMIVVTHDRAFQQELGLVTEWRLDRGKLQVLHLQDSARLADAR